MLSKKGKIMNLENHIIQVLKENMEGKPEIKIDSDLRNEYSLDSFSTLMIINDLEDDFNISIKDTEFEEIRTAADIVKILREKYHVQQ
jgi:acyl carrier protein